MIEWIISSLVLIVLVISLRFILKGKISLRLQYALWFLVLIRLLIPFNFGTSEVSVINAVPERVIQFTVPERKLEVPTINPGSPPVPTEKISRDVTPESSVTQPMMPSAVDNTPIKEQIPKTDVLKRVWITGSLLLGLVFIGTNILFYIKVRKTRRPFDLNSYKLPVYITDAIDTPCLFGLLNPTIYLTPETVVDERTLHYAIEHELTHFRHGDYLWSLLRGVCLALHWYNLLVWWAAILSRNDSELACDEATISRIGEDNRAEYGRTLIGMTCQKRPALLLGATTMTGSKSSIKERIMFISKKPQTAIYTLLAVLFIAVVAVGCTFTGANVDKKEERISIDFSHNLSPSIVDYAKDIAMITYNHYTEDCGYEILEAKIVDIREMYSGTDAPNHGLKIFRFEAHYRPKDMSKVMFVDNLRVEDGYLVDDMPLLLMCWHNESGEEPTWERICHFSPQEILTTYVQPEMLMKYGNEYKAAAIEQYKLARDRDETIWGGVNLDYLEKNVVEAGFTAFVTGTYEEIGQKWVNEYLAQHLNTNEDNPLHVRDYAVLDNEFIAESMFLTSKKLIFKVEWVFLASDSEAFGKYYSGVAVPMHSDKYPQYRNWMYQRLYIQLMQTGEGEWRESGSSTDGAGGWGYMYHDHDGYNPLMDESAFESLSYISNDNKDLAFTPLFLAELDWQAFESLYGVEGWQILLKAIDKACLTEGLIYDSESNLMWSDVYPNDQAYRNLYVMLSAQNSYGMFTEGLTQILIKQRNYNPEIFNLCLESLKPEQRHRIYRLLKIL